MIKQAEAARGAVERAAAAEARVAGLYSDNERLAAECLDLSRQVGATPLHVVWARLSCHACAPAPHAASVAVSHARAVWRAADASTA